VCVLKSLVVGKWGVRNVEFIGDQRETRDLRWSESDGKTICQRENFRDFLAVACRFDGICWKNLPLVV